MDPFVFTPSETSQGRKTFGYIVCTVLILVYINHNSKVEVTFIVIERISSAM